MDTNETRRLTALEKMMLDYPPSRAATKKLGAVPDGFAFYEFGWLGDHKNANVMKCVGAVFREAKRGPRKGERCIKAPGTMQTVFITSDEIKAASMKGRPNP